VISASAVTMRHELIMSLVAGLNPIMQGVEASGHEPVRKLWTTEGELASSRESLLAIGGMRAETRLRQGVEASGHEPVRN